MANYLLYAEQYGLTQKDMVEAIHAKYPGFSKIHMNLACHPETTALQLISAAEEILVDTFGAGTGLSISPRLSRDKTHGNKNKPNRMCVRLDDTLRSRVQALYERMCFATYQDLLEAAIAEFVERHAA